MGFGRKVDPEPGRCRRTDGKKWRCSKEAYPDSKYCERHMHRGRNRSRKPVEVSSSSTTITTAPTATTIANPSPTMPSSVVNRDLSSTTPTISSYSQLPSSIMSESLSHHPSHHNPSLYPFVYPHSSSSRPPDYGLSVQNSTTTTTTTSSPYFCLKSDSYSSQSDKDYRLVSSNENHFFF